MNFYYVYKSLAHPELPATGLIQPFTNDERLKQARMAAEKLGGSIPWLVDPIDNRLKRAMGDRPNSEFIVDPNGRIVRKRAWSDPNAVRKDLEELVGKSETFTKPEDVKTNDILVKKDGSSSVPLARVIRAGLFPIVSQPVTSEDTPFFVKLRCECDLSVIDQGQGKLYLGFYLDPLYDVHWNNLNETMRFEIEASTGIELSQRSGEGARLQQATDTNPREFLLDVTKWPKDEPIRVTVHYSACTESTCHVVTQSYTVHRQRDIDGGAAPTAAFRGLNADGMVKLLMAGDKNGDGRIVPSELNSIQRPRFADYDTNRDGVLDPTEIREMAIQNTSQKEL